MDFENLYLEITRECSMCCEHCLRGNHEHEFMSIETLENSLKDINHIKTLLLSGGEPLLSIRILEKLPEIINKYNIKIDRIGIITNGTIYSKRHLKALSKLKEVCDSFGFFLSFDLFHRLEWKRLGLTSKVERNYYIYKKYLGIEKYPEEDYNSNILLFPKGRAEDFTQSRLKEIALNNHINIKFSSENDDNVIYYEDKVEGKTCIDVHGNIVGYSKSFEEEDREASAEYNVNNHSIRKCIINYISHKKSQKRYKKTLYN